MLKRTITRWLALGLAAASPPAHRHASKFSTGRPLGVHSRVQQAISYERDESFEFITAQENGPPNQRVQSPCWDWWPKPERKIDWHTSLDRIVGPRSFDDVQMEADGIFQLAEGSVMEETGGDSEIPERSGAELVAVGLVTRNLLQAEVLVVRRSIEDDIAPFYSKERRDLRDADRALVCARR